MRLLNTYQDFAVNSTELRRMFGNYRDTTLRNLRCNATLKHVLQHKNDQCFECERIPLSEPAKV